METKIKVDLLKKLRREKAWSQEQLAQISGLSLRTIQRIEKSGKAALESQKAIAAAFDIRAVELDESTNSLAITDEVTKNFYFRIDEGAKLTEVIGGAYGYRMNHDNPKTKEEADLLAEALQSIQDWGEVWAEIESGERVKASFELTQLINDLKENGFWLFGLRTTEEYPGIEGDKWPIANLLVMRSTNPKIIKLDLKTVS